MILEFLTGWECDVTLLAGWGGGGEGGGEKTDVLVEFLMLPCVFVAHTTSLYGSNDALNRLITTVDRDQLNASRLPQLRFVIKRSREWPKLTNPVYLTDYSPVNILGCAHPKILTGNAVETIRLAKSNSLTNVTTWFQLHFPCYLFRMHS